jgi:hypothetical protein
MLEYGYGGKRRESASVWCASSGTKDQTANHGKQEIEQRLRKSNSVKDKLEGIA